MSWDVFVQDLPADAHSTADIPADFAPQPIGRRAAVISAIEQIVPAADFSDPAWGRIETDRYAIEINMGEAETLRGFAFHTRGGAEAADVVADIVEGLGLRALDPGAPTGIFSREAARHSLTQWDDYRDEVLGP